MFPSISPFSRSFLLALLCPVLISACNSSDTTSSVDTGDVALLITDAPTSAYDEINVTAEQVTLIGEGQGHEAHLMTKTVTFNLLDLRNTFRRLSKCKAPVGTYSKVRFRIKNVELIKRNRDGTIAEHVIPRLERNMIELNARTQFAVDRLHKLVVKLDLDADASLGTDPDTGDPVFDPNATVDTDEVPTDTDAPPQEVTPVLMNELGDVVLDPQTTDSFQLCNTATDGSVECVQVNVSPDTVVMNNQLAQVTTGISGISETVQWQVFGHLDVTTDQINALQVIEHSTSHRSYSGTLSGDYDAVNDQFNLDVSGTPYPVKDVSLSGIYDSAGNVLDVNNVLGAGVNVEVIGILLGFGPSATLTPGVIIISDQQ
jgi:hypothetical protein